MLADFNAHGQPVRLRPDREHPVSRGFVCAKGTRFLEVANHPDRLLYPRQRQTDGGYKRVSWAGAMDFFAKRLQPVLDRHGPHALGIYFGNPLAFNTLGIVAMLGFMRALGTRNVFTAGSQDCNNKFAGAQIMHGSPLIHPIPDFEHADLALMLGTNPIVSQASFVHLEGGSTVFDRLGERGGRLVWVDPRRTESARRWGEHLAIHPGTDIFLILTLLHEMRSLYRPDPRVTGLEAWLNLAAHYPIPRTARLTGLAPQQIQRLATEIQTAPRATFHMSVGLNQGPFGTLCYLALQALAYLSGNFDRRGGLLFHPLGVLAAEAARRARVGTEPVRSRIGDFPGVLDSLPGGILADEILTPGPEQIRALLVVAGNPLKSIPGGSKLRRALKELELLVCVDLFQNDTGQHADLLLPASSWLERWDVANTTVFFQQAPLVQYTGPLRAAPGEARSEADILTDMSQAMGRVYFNNRLLAWLWKLRPSNAGLTALMDICLWPARLWLGGTQAIPSLRPRPGRYLGRGPRTPGHQVRFWSPELDGERERLATFVRELENTGSDQDNRFILICRRRRLGHNSWLHGATREGQTGTAAWLSPADLKNLSLRAGDEVELQTKRARLKLPVIAVEDVARGTVVVPHGLPEANVNALIPTGLEMIESLSGQHQLTGIPVRVRPL